MQISEKMARIRTDLQEVKRELEGELRAADKALDALAPSNVTPLRRPGRPKKNGVTA